jgi:two-component system chemotaxis response regulator CheB
MSFAGRRIRVLVVDDSAIVRKILTESLASEPDLEVVGSAPDPYIARMDGITFLQKLMRFRPMPVIVISSLGQASCEKAVEALRLGAVEVLAKPSGPYSVGELRLVLANKIRAAAAARVRPAPPAPPAEKPGAAPLPGAAFDPSVVVAIGASTGGTEAIQTILQRLPDSTPPIVITPPIPAGSARAVADRLTQSCAIRVKEAEDGDEGVAGRALVAPGDFHMLVRRTGAVRRVAVKTGPRVHYQRPAVDVLFTSVAECCGPDAIGVLLTGMGSDGAQGLLKMKQTGALTIAQDEATCVVFGMPREAIRMGAAGKVLPLDRIGAAVLAAAARGRVPAAH